MPLVLSRKSSREKIEERTTATLQNSDRTSSTEDMRAAESQGKTISKERGCKERGQMLQ